MCRLHFRHYLKGVGYSYLSFLLLSIITRILTNPKFPHIVPNNFNPFFSLANPFPNSWVLSFRLLFLPDLCRHYFFSRSNHLNLSIHRLCSLCLIQSFLILSNLVSPSVAYLSLSYGGGAKFVLYPLLL